jgi:hypothetical protein
MRDEAEGERMKCKHCGKEIHKTNGMWWHDGDMLVCSHLTAEPLEEWITPTTGPVLPCAEVRDTEDFMKDTELQGCFDATVWASEFCKRFPQNDEGTMLGWFANAIMAGYDKGIKDAPDNKKEPLIEWVTPTSGPTLPEVEVRDHDDQEWTKASLIKIDNGNDRTYFVSCGYADLWFKQCRMRKEIK